MADFVHISIPVSHEIVVQSQWSTSGLKINRFGELDKKSHPASLQSCHENVIDRGRTHTIECTGSLTCMQMHS